MLRELLRWQQPASMNPSERWWAWARLLAERYGRILGRHQGAAMTWVTPGTGLSQRCQRWERVVWSLHPRIDLAIGPILQQFWREEAAWLLPAPAHGAARSQPASAAETVILESRSAQGEARESRPQAGVTAGPAALAAQGPHAGWDLPLDRVFARVDTDEKRMGIDPKSAMTVSHTGRQVLLLREAVQVLRQSAESRLRVEEAPRLSLVTRQPVDLAPPVTTAAERKAEHAEWGERISASPIAPAFDIEQLTEQVVRQIDGRLVAHRERLGRSL
jgi:hypothetical protein